MDHRGAVRVKTFYNLTLAYLSGPLPALSRLVPIYFPHPSFQGPLTFQPPRPCSCSPLCLAALTSSKAHRSVLAPQARAALSLGSAHPRVLLLLTGDFSRPRALPSPFWTPYAGPAVSMPANVGPERGEGRGGAPTANLLLRGVAETQTVPSLFSSQPTACLHGAWGPAARVHAGVWECQPEDGTCP